MNEFINTFTNDNQDPPDAFIETCRRVFTNVIDTVNTVLGEKAFRPERALNAAVFDSVMYGLAKRLERSADINEDALREAYRKLLSDGEYLAATSRATSNEQNVGLRLRKSLEAFADV